MTALTWFTFSMDYLADVRVIVATDWAKLILAALVFFFNCCIKIAPKLIGLQLSDHN